MHSGSDLIPSHPRGTLRDWEMCRCIRALDRKMMGGWLQTLSGMQRLARWGPAPLPCSCLGTKGFQRGSLCAGCADAPAD